jgi:hypothetical protein
LRSRPEVGGSKDGCTVRTLSHPRDACFASTSKDEVGKYYFAGDDNDGVQV